MPYGIGLIGNRAHQNTFGPILHSRPDCQIVAAAEHIAAKGAPLEQAYGVRCVRDYDAVLEDPCVDIVSIATDFYLKRTLIKKAIECGKHRFEIVAQKIAHVRLRISPGCFRSIEFC